MNRKISRRQLAGIAGSGVVSTMASLEAVKAIAQSPARGTDLIGADDKAARESHRENSEALAKFEIPMSLEPAFQFKA